MSASQRILCPLFLPLRFRPSSPPSTTFNLRSFLFLRSSPCFVTLPRSLYFSSAISRSPSAMPCKQGKDGHKEQKWKEKSEPNMISTDVEGSSVSVIEDVTKRLDGLSVSRTHGPANASVQPMPFGNVQLANEDPIQGQNAIWKPKSYRTVSGATAVEVEETPVDKSARLNESCRVGQASTSKKSSLALSKLFKGNLLENFTVDNSTYAQAQIRATFYPKFENEKSDQEVRTRLIEMVSKGLATLEVSLKHSGSLFMYAGNEGGAYAKNSFGNAYAFDSNLLYLSQLSFISNFK